MEYTSKRLEGISLNVIVIDQRGQKGGLGTGTSLIPLHWPAGHGLDGLFVGMLRREENRKF